MSDFSGWSLVLICLGAFGWLIRQAHAKTQLESQLTHKERLAIYKGIIDPFVRILAATKQTPREQQRAMKSILSTDHRRNTFALSMVGSDNVAIAYNRMMQYVFRAEEDGHRDMEMIRHFTRLMLEMRRDFNSTTILKEIDMLASQVTDIAKIEETWNQEITVSLKRKRENRRVHVGRSKG